MIATFYHLLEREEGDIEVAVTYDGRVWPGGGGEPDDADVDIYAITLDNQECDVSDAEYADILKACLNRLDEDMLDAAADDGDYRYDLGREWDYD